ncbi:MAG: DNA mismatch repair protein MutS [Trueperaceae bacterium]
MLHPTQDPPLDGMTPLGGRGVDGDLELDVVVRAMALGDGRVASVVRRVLLDPTTDADVIRYRQATLTACLERPGVARSLYDIATRTLERRTKVYWGLVRRPAAVVRNGVDLMRVYRSAFRDLRALADAHRDDDADDPLAALLVTLRTTLSDALLADIDAHLDALRIDDGVRVAASLGGATTASAYVLEPPERFRQPASRAVRRWWRAAWRTLRRREATVFTYRVGAYDDSARRELSDLQGRGLARTATALAAACDELLWFFGRLRDELAFYLGGMALHERLTSLGAPVCFPQPRDASPTFLKASGLVDAGLAFTVDGAVVGNDVEADGKGTIVVTGANQGGKTTFLRSLGVAQLLMQAGSLVPARSFESSVATDVFTHFTRAEDAGMRRGRLDEELSRLDGIVSAIEPGALLLMNESFASTNEREGSELAEAIVRALTEAGVRVVFVTHLNRFARELHERRPSGTLFLEAERLSDGARTFRMIAGAPAQASYGEELYRALFGGPPVALPVEDAPPS